MTEPDQNTMEVRMSVLDQVVNLKQMSREQLTDEMSRRMVVGRNQMLTVWNMCKGAHSSAHSHPEEQIFFILSGEIEFEIDGERRRCRANDVGVIPGGTVHEAWVIEDVEMVNVFSPVRNDYLTQGALEYMKRK
jgi:quercetin dioxygenase-like cupin family protein